MLFRILSSLILFFLLFSHAFAANTEDENYQIIIRLNRSIRENGDSGNDTEKVRKLCADFLTKYPKSKNNHEILIIAAEFETSPLKAISYRQQIIKSSASPNDRLSAYIDLCSMLFLSSQYEQCALYAKKAVSLSPPPDQKKSILLMRIRSLLLLQEYENAGLLLKANKPVLGADAENLLFELVLRTGEGKTPAADSGPSSLYMLGRKFELEHNDSYAYSAYRDLRTKYPRSPEAMVCKNTYESLAKTNPSYNSEYAGHSAPVNYSHDYAVKNESPSASYTVLIGPVFDLNGAKRIKKEMTPDFGSILLVKGKDGFYLYVGEEPSAEKALALKIRIAEEYALNGKIALKKEDNGREYIYGE